MSAVQFWFEFGSTYSYVAAMRIDREAASAGVPVEWKPFLLGPLFKRQGMNDSPFNLFQAKGRYMWRDIERLCRKYDLRLNRPSRFPSHSLLAARVACLAEKEPWMPEFARSVFAANFVKDRDISDPVVIREILDSMGRDGAKTIEEVTTTANKERLREQTETAWELGIFGAPSFIVNGELFWGQDRLEQALDWSRGTTASNDD